MKRSGTLTVVCGSMFAGKSEELIRLARRSLYAKRKVQVFKPLIDARYDESRVVTHRGIKHEAIAVRDVRAMIECIQQGVEVVFIEEVQFFDKSVCDLAMELADSGVDVVCAGLDQDFRREPFGPMPRLLALADEVVKLRAICVNCGDTASHTYRLVDGKPAHVNDPIILVGASEQYEARCRKCFKLRGVRKKKLLS